MTFSDGAWIEVYRRVQMPRGAEREHAASYDPTTRMASGTPGLDELINGGYFVFEATKKTSQYARKPPGRAAGRSVRA